MKEDGRKNNGGKGGRKPMFEGGTERIKIPVPSENKQEYAVAINEFVQKKYKKSKHKK